MSIKLTKEFLLKHYIEKGKSTYEIAKEYDTNYQRIRYALRKHKITARPRGGHNITTLTGEKFGLLTVLKQVENNGRTGKTSAKWLCQCECGNQKEIIGRSLIRGATKSCGCRLNSKMWKGYGKISKTYWNSIMRGANRRGLKVNITIKYIWDKFLKQNGKCALTGEEINIFSNYSEKRHEHTASLDRIDSNKGYVKGNVQWVHRRVNLMKSNMTDLELINWCKKIVSHNKN